MRILIVACIEALISPWLPSWWLPVHLWGTAVTTVVGLAVFLRYTPLLGKRDTGTIPLWSWLVWWPWHMVAHCSAWWFRNRGAPPLTEVHPGWWLGAWPHRIDSVPDDIAVLDLTCELPKRVPSTHYLCVPIWDLTQPTENDFNAAVGFVLMHQRAGRAVLVHCAHGRGRSTTALIAAMLAAGMHDSWQDALTHVRTQRPNVRLSTVQQQSLTRWQERLVTGPTHAVET